MFKPRLVLFFLLSLILFSGCTATDVTKVSAEDFEQKSSTQSSSKILRLASGDSVELSIEVDGRMEVSGHRARIDPFGAVTLPLVGDVSIGGLKLDQARAQINTSYSSYFVNSPVVMLSTVEDIDAGDWGYVTITGRIGRPGRVQIMDASGIKLTEAIQTSGGFAASAKRSGILISRVDRQGHKIQVSVDFNEIGQEGNADADINLQDGDIVYVPERIF